MDEVSDRYRPAEVEATVADYWETVDAYAAAKAAHRDDPEFYFLDGPPYTTGAPHIGTAWNKALKDAYIRCFRMQGYDVYDRPGYDMHGLPIENKVEEKLGFETKKDIQEYGVDEFIEECKRFAHENLELMNEAFQSFGVWMDWDDPYKTVDPTYMEAAWWGFAQAHDRGLVERGKRSITQCPRCETAIAKNEVEYHQVEDPSIYVKFSLRDREGSLVIWTTTPWTIPGNTFVALDEELTYVGVRAEKNGKSEMLYVAEPLVEEVLKKGRYENYEVVEELSGTDLVGWGYEHPLAEEVPDHPQGENALRVYHAEYVEADRTGLVHSAPGHGEEDFERGTAIGFEPFCPVGGDGVFTAAAGQYADEFVRDANDDIIADLEAKKLLLADETYVHDYGQCWRCDTDIIQIVTDQWFINTSEFKEQMLELLDESKWYPDWARDHRFRDFIEESPDWNVSRQRYWGIPLPIWTPADWSGDVADVIVIDSREELAERVDQDIDPAEVDLHKPTVDELTISENGTTYQRVPDVLDVWLDSGVASWAALGYPETATTFEERWPMDLIIEAHDQTRGWFWSLLAMGTVVFQKNPYKRVLMHGHTLAEDGRKMSKSIGNVVEPSEAIDRHGRDAMRLFLLSHTAQGEDMRFTWDGMAEIERQLNILWNVFRFPLPYMELDDVNPARLDLAAIEDDLAVVDAWVLSRLQATVASMTADIDAFRQGRAIETLLDFVVEDVSRFYIQEVRERMWLEEDAPEKTAAYATIATILETVSRLLAPFGPYLAEKIHGTISDHQEAVTVHALDWPDPHEAYRDDTLERDVAVVREIEEAALTARQDAGRKLRWPVQRLIVETDDDEITAAAERRQDLLLERLNANTLEVVSAPWSELEEVARPRMDRIGPAYGERAEAVMAAVQGRAVASVRGGIDVDGETISLDEEMIAIEREPPGSVEGTDFEGGTVYVDATLSPEIEAEGYAREVVRRIQQMRKDLDLDIEERIRTAIDVEDGTVAAYVDEWRDYVARETRTETFVEEATAAEETWDVEDVRIEIGIEPAED